MAENYHMFTTHHDTPHHDTPHHDTPHHDTPHHPIHNISEFLYIYPNGIPIFLEQVSYSGEI
jgi:hypothetical protein